MTSFDAGDATCSVETRLRNIGERDWTANDNMRAFLFCNDATGAIVLPMQITTADNPSLTPEGTARVLFTEVKTINDVETTISAVCTRPSTDYYRVEFWKNCEPEIGSFIQDNSKTPADTVIKLCINNDAQLAGTQQFTCD